MRNVVKTLSRVRLTHFVTLIVLVSAVMGVVLAFSRKTETVYVDLAPNPLEYREDILPPAFTETDALTAGDAVYDSLGQKTLEITDVRRTEWKGNRKTFLLAVKVRSVYDPRTHQYSYFNTPLLVGNKLIFKTQKSYVTGQIVNVYHDEKDRFRQFKKTGATVTVRKRLLDPMHAEALQNFEVKDTDGNIMARTAHIQITPAQIDVETDKGVVYGGFSSYRKDILLTLELSSVYCSGQSCYYNDYQPIKIGSPFWISSNTMTLDDALVVDFSIHDPRP